MRMLARVRRRSGLRVGCLSCADAEQRAVTVGGTTSALRVFQPEQADVFRREARAMRVAAEAGIAVPTIHAERICGGRPALLLSWCAGQPLLNEPGRVPGASGGWEY
jgi:hypothetical protein